jgi:hypothetical protein
VHWRLGQFSSEIDIKRAQPPSAMPTAKMIMLLAGTILSKTAAVEPSNLSLAPRTGAGRSAALANGSDRNGSGHWDTVPYFIHCGNTSGGVSEPLLALMAGAHFTVVQVQQGMDSNGSVCSDELDPAKCNATGAEGKVAALAAKVRAVNPNAKTVLYMTVDNIRVESDLGRYFLAHPELTLSRYNVNRANGQLGNFSMFQYVRSDVRASKSRPPPPPLPPSPT